MAKETAVNEPIERFDAITIVKSEKYKQFRDLLCIELDEDKLYSHDEIKNIIEKALARPVQKEIN